MSVSTAALSETVERLRSFNRGVSHDLCGPLGAMSGVARLTMAALVQGNTPRAMELLSLTANHAEALAHLVGELLALSELESFALRPVDLNLVLREALDQLALVHRDGSLRLADIAVAPLPMVMGSPALLRQVFVNLLGNALKFTRGVPCPRIEVGTTPARPHEATLFVADNGIGFDATEASTLFKPFHRLHGQRFGGTGVGLDLTKRIIERHGGRIWADGEPGQGATFSFALMAAAVPS
jgi:signal transduction histidine kinase